MKIALAQLNYTVGDVEGNASKIIEAIEKAKQKNVDLVVFAEQALSGTPAYDLLNKATFVELCEEELERIAEHCDSLAAIVGSPVAGDEGTVSAAVVIERGQITRRIAKQYVDYRDEMGYIHPSSGAEVIRVAGEQVAVVVGNDLVRVRDCDQSVTTIININARRFRKRVLEDRYEKLHHVAYVEGKNLVFVNHVGGSTDMVYDGTSSIYDAKGELVLLLDTFKEDFKVCDLGVQNEPIATPFSYYQNRTRNLHDAIKCGLKDYFYKNGYKKACVGLSGGIDSSVVLSIAVDALGVENVRAMMMPSQFSSDHSVEDAVKLADNLGVEYNVVPITEAYKSIVESLMPVVGGTPFDATEENIQARIRTIMLMALQNKQNYVMLNSSNKSENALGWCTLYGDTAGAISITGDVYKSEIYDLARYINREREIIPENILNKEPSSELYAGQKDSDLLPPYEVVDAILYRMIERGQHREEIINAGFDAEVVHKIHKMVMRNEKKRFQFCPMLRLSSCTLGCDRVLPLTNKYGD